MRHTELKGWLRFTCCLTMLSGCHAERPEQVNRLNADYLRLHCISEQRDDVHTLEVHDSQGRTWYLEEQAGLDLRYCLLNGIVVKEEEPGKSWYFVLSTRPEFREQLQSWWRPRIGRRCGFVVGDQLVETETLREPLSLAWISVHGFSTEDSAKGVVAAIKQGGWVDGSGRH